MSEETDRRNNDGLAFLKLIAIPIILVAGLCSVVIDVWHLGLWTEVILIFVSLTVVNLLIYYGVFLKRVARNE